MPRGDPPSLKLQQNMSDSCAGLGTGHNTVGGHKMPRKVRSTPNSYCKDKNEGIHPGENTAVLEGHLLLP